MVEILSPVGDFEMLTSAIDAGCNAVYFGIAGLNMRSASAKNFTIDDMEAVAKQCHSNNVKCYLTLNTLVYNHEFPRLEKILNKVKEVGVDAIIVTDFGAINLARKLGIEVHVSTQASIANAESAKFYAELSPRLVLARECSLEQIRKMKDDLIADGKDTELEIFVHGALCVAESGRCFMSQFHNRISANRGQCLQECRREYKVIDVEEPRREFKLDNQFVMSPKDLCALPILDKLVEAGVDVFKIEGRAKGPEYVYKVTKVYKEALTAIEEGTFNMDKVADWLEELTEVYNRGFTDNFMLGTPTNDSWSNAYGSLAKKVKTRVGKIINYYVKAGMAEAELENHEVKVGDKIIITGPTTGFMESVITSIRTDEDGSVDSVKKTKFTFPLDKRVRLNDKLFVVTENKLTPAEERINKYDFHEPFKTTKDKSKGCD